MSVQIQLRRDTAANFTAANTLLASGEFGLETDTGNLKIGDGSTVWTSLGYFPTTVGTSTFKDANLFIVDDGDVTKKLQFQCSGITTATTRTVTLPDASLTMVGTATTQTLSNKTLDNTTTATLKDTLFTVQDDGDATKLLAFQCSGITTGTTRTLTVPNASGTIVLNDNTATITNKTIGVTQLNGSANTVAVNNTGATANYTETTYKDVAKAAYTDTIAWTGTTAPSGATNHEFWWKQVGNLVTVTTSLSYATAGSALSLVDMILPAAIPVPVAISGTTTNDKVASGTGWIDSATNGTPPSCRVWMIKNASTYSIRVGVASNNSKVAFATITYSTN